jgi:hypothetical protein
MKKNIKNLLGCPHHEHGFFAVICRRLKKQKFMVAINNRHCGDPKAVHLNNTGNILKSRQMTFCLSKGYTI